MIQQSDRQAWNQATYGRLSASVMGALHTEPRSISASDVERFAHLVPDRYKVLQSGPRKGQTVEVEGYAGQVMEAAKALGHVFFGDTAMAVIKQKALERVIGRRIQKAATWSMRRGTLLEHAACYLLSRYWQPTYACTWMPIGNNSGATPDFLLRDGSPGDIKCKESEGLLFDLATEVTDWYSLLKWNKDEAWQIATQAMAAGSTKATLLYFTDKLQSVKISREEYDMANATMQVIGDKLFELTGQMYEYTFDHGNGEPGFLFVAKTMDIPQEAFDRINAVLERAEVECDKWVKLYGPIYANAPTPEEVEATIPAHQ